MDRLNSGTLEQNTSKVKISALFEYYRQKEMIRLN